MKFKIINPSYLFSSEKRTCALHTNASPFISSTDSISVSAARLVILNLCLLKEPPILDIIDLKPTKKHYVHFVDTLSTVDDGFDFLSDLFDVSPPQLTNLLVSIFKSKFNPDKTNQIDIHLLGCSLQFLSESPLRPVLIHTVSKYLPTLPMNDILSLGILLYSISFKILYLDVAIKLGFIQNPISEMKSISKHQQTNNENKDNNKEKAIDKIKSCMLSSPMHLTVILRIFEKLYKKFPGEIYRLLIKNRNYLIDVLLANEQNLKMAYFINAIPPQRFDFDFLSSPKGIEQNSIPISLNELIEIEYSICRQNSKRFGWFTFSPEDSNVYEVFPTLDPSKPVKLSATDLIIGEKNYRLWKFTFVQLNRKNVEIEITNDSGGRRVSLIMVQKARIEIPFAHAKIAKKFTEELLKYQKELIEEMLRKLKTEDVINEL
ncbi:hypothetical protein GPJ56_007355 [Histomonas meleagridis]|uniref:uncharacterized protein n=1 Tax=Histomonas meleagridis TaxID=135588 RepID=UPI00355A5AE3|nr:hypothetical protein GPJ56_007355 [Histomonas meleagridis]KAH0804201.1 hypothetical protein GO595_003031 [Histomonas meleagridis]